MKIRDIRFNASDQGDAMVIELTNDDGSAAAAIYSTVAYFQGPAEKHATKAAEYSEKHGVDLGPAIEAAYRKWKGV